MMFKNKKETIVKAVLSDASEVYIFTDFSFGNGGAITAMSRLESATAYKASRFVTAHVGADRDSDTVFVNVNHIVKYEKASVDVPARIVDLFTPSVDETEEQLAEREDTIKNYFCQI